MARLNVYVPDDLAERARHAELNVSALVQSALADELDRRATAAWLETVPIRTGTPLDSGEIAEAVRAARDEFGAS